MIPNKLLSFLANEPNNIVPANVITEATNYRKYLRSMSDCAFIAALDEHRDFNFPWRRSADQGERIRHYVLVNEAKRRMTTTEFEKLIGGAA